MSNIRAEVISKRYLRKVKIANKYYSIYQADRILDGKIEYDGVVSYPKRRIIIRKGRDFDVSLIHELLHCFIHEIYYKSKKKKYRLLCHDEYFIDNLTLLVNNMKGGKQ